MAYFKPSRVSARGPTAECGRGVHTAPPACSDGGCALAPHKAPHPSSRYRDTWSWGSGVHPRGESAYNQGSSFLQVARQLQPSVVWIGDTEKTFYRKVPSAERMVRAPLSFLSLPFLSSEGHLPGALCFRGRREMRRNHLCLPRVLVCI